MQTLRGITLATVMLTMSGTVAAQASATTGSTAAHPDVRVALTARFTPGGGGLLRVSPGGSSRAGYASVRLTCRAPDGGACSIGIGISEGRRTVAKAHKVLKGSTTLSLRLSPFAQAQLRHHGIRLTVAARATDHHHHHAVAGFTGTLRLG